MSLNIEDIEYELELVKEAGETETDPFSVMINEIDDGLLELLENLPANIELKRFSSDIEIREREKSYEIISMKKKLFLAKRHKNIDMILKLLRQRLFSDILYKEIFVVGLAFTFRRKDV